jgi:hypothetical protein
MDRFGMSGLWLRIPAENERATALASVALSLRMRSRPAD